jgi:hypothetical protein
MRVLVCAVGNGANQRAAKPSCLNLASCLLAGPLGVEGGGHEVRQVCMVCGVESPACFFAWC